MNIVIGSIVICKIIVSSPEFDEIKKDNTTSQKQILESSTPIAGNSQVGNVMSVFNGSQPEVSKAETNTVSDQKYAMIKGIVEDIREFSYLKEVPEYNKFKYEKEYSYIIKTDEYEKILIKSTACGNYEQFVVSDAQLDKIKQKKAEIEVLEKEQEIIKNKKVEEPVETKQSSKNKAKKVIEVDPFIEMEKNQLNLFRNQEIAKEKIKEKEIEKSTVVPESERVDVQSLLDQQRDLEVQKEKSVTKPEKEIKTIDDSIKANKNSKQMKKDRMILKDVLNPFYK